MHLMMNLQERMSVHQKGASVRVSALTINFISLASKFHQQCHQGVQVIVITPGTSASSKGMCIKHVKAEQGKQTALRGIFCGKTGGVP